MKVVANTCVSEFSSAQGFDVVLQPGWVTVVKCRAAAEMNRCQN